MPIEYTWVPGIGVSNVNTANPFTSISADQQYVLFVEDAEGCKDLDSVFVAFKGPKADAGWGLDTICIIDQQLLGGDPTATGGTMPYVYNWAPNIYLNDYTVANPVTNTPQSMTYVLTVIDVEGCSDIDSIYLWYQTLGASFVPVLDDIIAPADVLFDNTTTIENPLGEASYVWDFGDSSAFSTEENPDHLYTYGGDYTVTLVAYSDETQLCADTFAYTFIIYPPAQIYIPNVISPNGDGFNDVFEIKDEGIATFECIIYNRWGTEMYRFDEFSNNWDGRSYSGVELPEGTYFYMLQATGKDRSEKSLRGTFTLLR